MRNFSLGERGKEKSVQNAAGAKSYSHVYVIAGLHLSLSKSALGARCILKNRHEAGEELVPGKGRESHIYAGRPCENRPAGFSAAFRI